MLKFAVDLYGSHPNENNDDCWNGISFETMAEANDCFWNPLKYFNCYVSLNDVAFIKLEGPSIKLVRPNPDFRPEAVSNDDWARENAMQNGMMGGCDSYNDSMGY